MRRKDHAPEAIRNRLAVYDKQTAPVLDWYKSHGGRIVTVSAVGAVEDVTRRALKELGR